MALGQWVAEEQAALLTIVAHLDMFGERAFAVEVKLYRPAGERALGRVAEERALGRPAEERALDRVAMSRKWALGMVDFAAE